MKKLLKSGICGSVNSARMHYSRLTWSNSVARKKRNFRKRRRSYNSNPNGHYISTSLPRTSFLSIPNKPPILRLQVLGKNKNKNFDCHISIDCNQKKKKKSLNSSKKILRFSYAKRMLDFTNIFYFLEI